MNYKKHILLLLFILIIGFIPLLDLFHPGLPVTHDGQDHVARIANFYQNLSEGNIIPRWAANLNWGYGHPILMFLYPLPSYFVSFFHFLGFSLIESVKLVLGTTFILSGLFMYLWMRSFLGWEAGLIAAALYTISPYRFVDLYVRGAIGEHVAFVFPPLIFYFLFRLFKKSSFFPVVGAGLSLAGLVLSHNAISLMFLPLIIFYFFYLLMQVKEKRQFLFIVFLAFVLGFSLSAFFWMPAFFEGKYTLRNIVTTGSYLKSFVAPFSLFYGAWSYGGSGQFSVQLGSLNWLMLVSSFISIFYFRKKNNFNLILILGIIIYSLSVIFLMLKESNFIWQRIMILQNFQFTWRFLTVLLFTTAALGGFFVSIFPKRVKILIVFGLFFFVLLLNKDYWHARGYIQKSESFFNNIYFGTTDTGESAPIWSIRFMEHSPKAHIEVISGEAVVSELSRSSTVHRYKITAKGKARIRENTLYFPGWEILVDGRPSEIEFQDPANRGLMTFYVEKGKHLIVVRFKETKLRLLADSISGLALASLAFLVIIRRRNLWQRFR